MIDKHKLFEVASRIEEPSDGESIAAGRPSTEDRYAGKRFLDATYIKPNSKHRHILERKKANKRRHEVYRVVCLACFVARDGADRPSLEQSLEREGWQYVKLTGRFCQDHRRDQ